MLTPFMRHPHNRTGTGGIRVFTSGNSKQWYPGFYNDWAARPYVIDAKYKHLDNDWWSREDFQQIISYIHLLRVEWGALAFPHCDYNPGAQRCIRGQLNGLGGMLYTLAFNMPKSEEVYSSFIEYSAFMKKSEEALTSTIRSFS